VDAAELLRGDAPFIVDTSAWWRFSSLSSELVEEAIVDDRLWITPIVRMEILYSARSTAEYIAPSTSRSRRNSTGFGSYAMIVPSPTPP
jgi:predicted nucleic acid-binding protein